ncbi:PPE family protein PPE2-like isoform X2 [Dermacentor silvarum]|uniref:PPE family protein PPE2-like isoform X2 n=1 Tax=Dermacentor silvarum TaxID=543639 RepID=UPI002101C09E|nr:PPE family protein PPE2-like isoform X2 [Dermacentor silvarum]
MKLQHIFPALLLCLSVAQATMPPFTWLPRLFTPPSLTNVLTGLLPFPLALPLALVGPMPFALPVLVGLKAAGLLGLGVATGGAAGAGMAGLGAIGLKAALINSAALKIAGLGAMAAKAKVTSAAAKAAAEAGVKAIVHQAKSKIAAPPAVAHVAPVAPVVAAPTVPVVPAVTTVKVIKTPPVITVRPVPVNPWKFAAALPTGWDHSMTYGHPYFGYGFTRSAIELRKRREAPSTNAALDPAVGMNPQVLKSIFEYVTSYDAERCVLRVVYEVAAKPSLAGPQGKNVAEFMASLSKDNSGTPWMPYRDAAATGQVSANRKECQERYPTCSQSTEALVELAQTRIAQASESVTGAATRLSTLVKPPSRAPSVR